MFHQKVFNLKKMDCQPLTNVALVLVMSPTEASWPKLKVIEQLVHSNYCSCYFNSYPIYHIKKQLDI